VKVQTQSGTRKGSAAFIKSPSLSREDSYFIELRERGAEAVIAVNLVDWNAYGVMRQNHFYSHSHHSQIDSPRENIPVNNFCEAFYSSKSHKIHVKPCKMERILTPYVLTETKSVHSEGEETFLTTDRIQIVTCPKKRKAFAEQVFNLANRTEAPVYKIAALKAMEQCFVSYASNNLIERELAEKKYDVYDKLQTLFWRGATPGEQTAAFGRAYTVLANVLEIARR